jgi:hypothetical protein
VLKETLLNSLAMEEMVIASRFQVRTAPRHDGDVGPHQDQAVPSGGSHDEEAGRPRLQTGQEKNNAYIHSCYFDGRFGVAVGILAYYARGYVVR